MSETPPYTCVQHQDPMVAYGRTVRLLRSVKPFADYRFGVFATVLLSQILRKHYVLTYSLPDKVEVGYFGWALCEEKIAKAWVEDGYVPSHEECQAGDCFVGATFHAVSPAVTRFQSRFVRSLYPNLTKLYGRRDYGERIRPLNIRNVVQDV